MRKSRSIIIILLIALLAPILANEKPLLLISDNGWSFPVLENDVNDWNQKILNQKVDGIIFQPLIPWTAGKTDYENADFVSPFGKQQYRDNKGMLKELPLRHRHLLGTDLRGTDVLSGLLNALRITFFIGLVSTFFAALIAIFAGVFSAWYAAEGIRISWFSLLAVLISILVLIAYSKEIFYAPEYFAQYAGVFVIFLMILFLLRKFVFIRNRFSIILPFDAVMTRLTEVFSTFPRFIFVIVMGAFLRPSVFQVILLLSITGWSDMARLLRAEILRLREHSFIDAGRISGAGSFRIVFRHLLPNAWPVLSVALLYSLALNILMEAGLGFLGMGIPDTYVSLGGMMAQGKYHLNAWWVILFPGLVLSGTLYLLYLFAESLRPEFDQERS